MNSLFVKKIAAFFLILAICGLHFVHLGADTPEGISSNVGLYVDEGYKTFSPRNLVLFGDLKWHAEDEYTGWMTNSPMTQWPYYLAFKAFGVDVKNARIVTVLYFFIMLCGYAFTMIKRYNTGLFLLGLILLGGQNTLFFFSRVALFEVPIATFLYLLLFLLTRLDHSRIVTVFFLIFTITIAACEGVKASALIYFLPVTLAVAVSFFYRNNWIVKKNVFFVCAVLLCAVTVVLSCYHGLLINRFTSSFFGTVRRILIFEPLVSAPIIVIMGTFVAFHGLLCKPDAYLRDFYRASLIGIILLSPIILALFPYNPLRYYVPILPAYILLLAEWIQLTSWNDSLPVRLPFLRKLGLVVGAFLLFFYTASSFNSHILMNLPIAIGGEPGISSSGLVKFLWPIALIFALIIYRYRQWVFSKKIVGICYLGAGVIFFLYNGYNLGLFLLHPSYKSREIQREVGEIIPQDAIIAGDFAPFIFLNLKNKTLYLNDEFNQKKLKVIMPDYIVHTSKDDNPIKSKAWVMETYGVFLGDLIYKESYWMRNIEIFSVSYSKELGD